MGVVAACHISQGTATPLVLALGHLFSVIAASVSLQLAGAEVELLAWLTSLCLAQTSV